MSFLLFLAVNIVYIRHWRDLWIILPISLSIEFIYNKRWRGFQWEKKHWYLCVVLLYFSLYYLHLPFEETYYRGWQRDLVRNNLQLLVLTYCAFLGFGKEHKLSYYLNTVIVVAVLSVLYLLFYKIGWRTFINTENKQGIFYASRVEVINHHMKYNMYLNLALIAIWYLLSRGYQQMRWWLISYYVLCFAILFYVISISEGRNGFLMSLLIVVFIVFVETWKRKKWLTVVGLVGVLLSAAYIIPQHKKINEATLKREPRLFLLDVAKGLIKEKPTWGWGANEGQYTFTQHRMMHPLCEQYDGEFWYYGSYMNTDSQYVQTLVEYGVVGLVLLLIIYTMPFFLTQKKQLALLLIALIAIQAVTQVMMTDDFIPLLMYAVLILLFFSDDILPQKRDITTS